MIQVLLAEDHHLVRKGIRALLEQDADIEVIGEVGNGQDAVEFVNKHRPDIAILDINMPILNGIQVTKIIRSEELPTKIVILSMYSGTSIVHQAINAGVDGYLLKRSLLDELSLAIRSVHQGESYLSPGVSHILFDYFIDKTNNNNNENPYSNLTSRERHVMQLIAEGQTTKSIASLLSLSNKTIEKYRSNLMSKLDLHDIAGVVRMAAKFGLIFLDE